MIARDKIRQHAFECQACGQEFKARASDVRWGLGCTERRTP